MAGPETPDAPPPEVPEEFADAYREAYRRALESDTGFDPHELVAPDVSAHEVVQVGTHRAEEPAPAASNDWQSARWFLPVAIGAAGLALVLTAYAVGTALSGNDHPATRASASRTTAPSAPASSHPKPTHAAPSMAPEGWDGSVTRVSVDAVSADCTSPPSTDSAGHKVTYVPENTIDDKSDTAWRCDGTAIGQKLTLRLGGAVDVGEVGLVPGYAKTDPVSGVDRYAENNRITRVRWTLGNGVSVVQRLTSATTYRALQAIRVPRTSTDTVTLEVLGVKHGPRNTTAISQIEVAAAD